MKLAKHPNMLYRQLGSTGEEVSAIGLGGWQLGLQQVDEPLSFRIVRTAIDRGITFMDNSWDYNNGLSETRLGKALRDGYRDKVLLMTKLTAEPKRKPPNSSTNPSAVCKPTTSTSSSITK